MLRFGFELECFYLLDGIITVPPDGFPHDGFPGLVEFRTTGHFPSLEDAYGSLMAEVMKYGLFNASLRPEHTFSADEKRQMRKRGYVKEQDCVCNLYDKKPRSLGNKTIASFQISVSNLEACERKDDKGVIHPERFTLLDVPTIVRSLDKEFKKEVLASGRQIGEYAIKGPRLEYRSLPNNVFPVDPYDVTSFLLRIKNCIK